MLEYFAGEQYSYASGRKGCSKCGPFCSAGGGVLEHPEHPLATGLCETLRDRTSCGPFHIWIRKEQTPVFCSNPFNYVYNVLVGVLKLNAGIIFNIGG